MSIERPALTPVLLESPYRPGPDVASQDYDLEVELRVRYARLCMRHCFFVHHESPFVSHLLFTQKGVLDDRLLDERDLGIEGGLVWGAFAKRSVVYIDLGISPGMWRGISRAFYEGRPVELRRLPDGLESVLGRRSRWREQPSIKHVTKVFHWARDRLVNGESLQPVEDVFISYDWEGNRHDD